jgi:hypothetical protein
VRELVIVLSDLYLAQEDPRPTSPSPQPLPGLERIVRLATASSLEAGWRSRLARWAGAEALATMAPATVAAYARAPAEAEPRSSVWLASAVHLVAGLTTLYLDRRSLLRLQPGEAGVLASQFNRDFHDSGFHLEPLETGDFLLFGPGTGVGGQPDPATLMGGNVADTHQASGAEYRALRRLGAESEMWLHSHAINDERRRRGELPVTGLWFWGGGLVPVSGSGARSVPATDVQVPVAFAFDAFVQGLWSYLGSAAQPVPAELHDVLGYPVGERAAVVIELGPMLHSNPSWSFLDAVAQADRNYLSPAIEALSSGRLQRLNLLANGREFALRGRDRLRFWRRTRPGLVGLQ